MLPVRTCKTQEDGESKQWLNHCYEVSCSWSQLVIGAKTRAIEKCSSTARLSVVE